MGIFHKPQPEPSESSNEPTQPCLGPGDHVEDTSSNGVHRETWHGCPDCHGSH